MRWLLIVVALTGCGGGGSARPEPIANLAPGTRASAVGVPAIDTAAFQRLVEDRAWSRVIDLATAMARRRIDDGAGYPVTCQAVGNYVECGQPGLGEYDLVYTFRFERRSGGYVLTGVETYDVGTVADDVETAYDAELAKTAAC